MILELLDGKLEKGRNLFKTVEKKVAAVGTLLEELKIPSSDFYHSNYRFLGLPGHLGDEMDLKNNKAWRKDSKNGMWKVRKNNQEGKELIKKFESLGGINLGSEFCKLVGLEDRFDMKSMRYLGCGGKIIGDRMFLELSDLSASRLKSLSETKEVSAIEYQKLCEKDN